MLPVSILIFDVVRNFRLPSVWSVAWNSFMTVVLKALGRAAETTDESVVPNVVGDYCG